MCFLLIVFEKSDIITHGVIYTCNWTSVSTDYRKESAITYAIQHFIIETDSVKLIRII